MQLIDSGIVVPSKTRSKLRQRIIDKTSAPTGPNGCRIWKASYRQGKGRPQIRGINPHTGKSTVRDASRALLEEVIGRPLKRHEYACHHRGCLPGCVTEGHAYVGSALTNAQDAKAEGVKMHRKMTPTLARELVTVYRKIRDRGEPHIYIMAILTRRFGISEHGVRNIVVGKTWSKATGITFVAGKPGRPSSGTEIRPIIDVAAATFRNYSPGSRLLAS